MLEALLDRLTGGKFLRLVQHLQDVRALQQLAPLTTEFVPWTGSALRPAALVTVLNDLVVNRRRRVVECGGGVSSLYIAELLERTRDGELLVLEHDAEWARRLRTLLRRRGLAASVRVVHAPLEVNGTVSPWGTPWYAVSAVREALGDRRIDLLVVDGPPAHEEGMGLARFPAVPFFQDHLAESCTIVLDDVDRDGERKVVSLWEEELGVTFQLRERSEGIARGVLGASYTV